MEDFSNSIDLGLLQNDPKRLIIRYQTTIRIIVQCYVRSGMFHPSEVDDTIQQINSEILGKLTRIREQYNGSTLFRTYLSNIVRHACLSLHTKRQSEPMFLRLDSCAPPLESKQADRRLLIEHDIRVFRAILDQFHREKFKLMLCLKLIYRIPINRQDVLNWWPACPPNDLNALLRALDGKDEDMTDKQVFSILQPLVNKAETSSGSADSIRRWVDERITKILKLLNDSPPTSAHTRETLGILLDDYFTPFLL
jgi:hypothetical protein